MQNFGVLHGMKGMRKKYFSHILALFNYFNLSTIVKSI